MNYEVDVIVWSALLAQKCVYTPPAIHPHLDSIALQEPKDLDCILCVISAVDPRMGRSPLMTNGSFSRDVITGTLISIARPACWSPQGPRTNDHDQPP